MSASPQVERVNLADRWPDKPAIYSMPPQDDTARYYAGNLLKLLRSGKKPEPDDMQWLNMYKLQKSKNRNNEEIEGYIEEHSKKDIHMFFMSEVATMKKDYEDRMQKIHDHYLKILADKDKRIDDVISKQSEQKGKDFAEMVKLVANASKDGAENANKHLSTALTTTNSLNNTLLSTMQSQWQNVGNLSKKHFDELNKMLDEKEKEEPGFFNMFFTEIILPNKDKIENAISKLSGPVLTGNTK